MDIVSHGLYGAIAFGRKNRRSFWLSFFLGVSPDLFSFGTYFIATFLGFYPRLNFSPEPPDPSLIPAYVGSLYNITHSLIIFLAVFLAVWLIRKKPLWELSAWGLHVLLDIPTHSYSFFPTPFLWPLSGIKIDGWHWGSPWIFIPNVAFLVLLYSWFFIKKRIEYIQHARRQ